MHLTSIWIFAIQMYFIHSYGPDLVPQGKFIRISEHKLFEKSTENIHTHLQLSFGDAVYIMCDY